MRVIAVFRTHGGVLVGGPFDVVGIQPRALGIAATGGPDDLKSGASPTIAARDVGMVALGGRTRATH